MNRYLSGAAVGALSLALVTEAAATEWNVSLWGKRRAFTEHVEKLAELVSAKTNGEFTLNISYGGLSKNTENLDGISIGAFEMAQFCASYHADKNPSITVLELPFIGEALTLIGAVPTSVTSEEARQALDSGIVKSIAFAPHAHMSFGVMEVAKWWTDNLNPGTVNCPVVVNTDALNALSDSEREALLGSVDEAMAYYVDFYNNETMAKWWPLIEEKGIQKVSFNDERLAEFREKAAGPVAAKWIEENTARGLPAQELYDLVISTLAN